MATILIVDDEADCRKPLSALLRHAGYETIEARDGAEGLQRLAERRVDLILLDLNMPGCDGVTMLQAVRRNSDWLALPVFLVTGEHDPERLRLARAVGLQEYLFKGDTPFAKMIELIKRHLGEHHVPKRRGRKPKVRPEAQHPPGSGVGGPNAKPQQPQPMSRHMQLCLRFFGNEDAA